MDELRAEHVTVRMGKRVILAGLNLRARPGELLALLGANGAGKSTLLRALIGLVPVEVGTVTLDGHPIRRLAPGERARRMAYLPQQRPLAWPVRARDVVALGRFAYGAAPSRLAARDAQAVQRALTQCDLSALADARTDQLSGGEAARVHCARAFATEAPWLLADEPVAGLDPRHQLQIMTLLREHVNAGRGAIVVMHDPALAARFADRLLWLAHGRLIADGPAASTLTPARLAEVFGVHAAVGQHGGQPSVNFLQPL